MAISAKDVKKLREMTGAGMMDCKKALTEANGDFDGAVDYLRKKGQKVAAKRADRDATEGVVIATTNEGGDKGVVLYVTSETDFVSKNEEFVDFAKLLAQSAMIVYPETKEQVNDIVLEDKPIKDHLLEMVAKIGEKIEIGSYDRFESEMVVPYIHAGNKLGVLVGLNKSGEKYEAIGKDVAMQIAALNAVGVDESDVPQEVKDRELKVGREKAIEEGKPENLIERIAEGTLKKFYKENTLLSQKFVKDGSKTVEQALKEVDPELKITGFKRMGLGK